MAVSLWANVRPRAFALASLVRRTERKLAIVFPVFRVGLLDLIALTLVAVVLLMPGRSFVVEPMLADIPDDERKASALRDIASGQAELLHTPGDGKTAELVADALRSVDMHHAAARVAGDAYEAGASWRAALAVSAVHADRIEIEPAFEYATLALKACDAKRAECPEYDRIRIDLYHQGLEAGMASGVDPRTEPKKFRAEVLKAFPRVRGGKR